MKSGMLLWRIYSIQTGVEKVVTWRLHVCTEGEDFFAKELTAYRQVQQQLVEELYRSRNFGPAMQNLARSVVVHLTLSTKMFKVPFTLHDLVPDCTIENCRCSNSETELSKPDGKLTFDRLSSVFVSNTA